MGKASVLFIHSLELHHHYNISLAAKESGKTVWLPLEFMSLSYSSANRDLAPQMKGGRELVEELAESLYLAFFDCLKGGKGLMLLFLVIGVYAYLTFSMNDLFCIDKRIVFVARHMMIFHVAFALSA